MSHQLKQKTTHKKVTLVFIIYLRIRQFRKEIKIMLSHCKYLNIADNQGQIHVFASFKHVYPLVNIHKAMENGHRNSGFSH